MITARAFSGKRYAVLGLARSGLATAEALLASGARVTAWDSEPAQRAALGEHPALTLADPLEIDLAGFDAIVVSPGVPLNRHPIATRAREAGVPLIGDIELFALARRELPPHRVVGITGTNGKSTTTALIHHICEVAGLPARLGGNIGLPILAQDPLAAEGNAAGVYVLELSSYQIDLTHSLDCDVALLTNITPDHLDRYDGFRGYAASKRRLFAMQSPDHVAVIAVDDAEARTVAARLRAGELDAEISADAAIAVGLPAAPVPARAGPRVVEVSTQDVADQSRWPTLQGPHNAQNAALAIATARALGIDEATIEHGLATYPGLPHRMERVAEKAGVLYVNDSKATNPTATAPALAAYPNVHWILGGVPKGDDLDACAPHFSHIVAAYTIGEAGPRFAELLRAAGKAVSEAGTLDQAVRTAAAAARPGEVVLLSPACASFDQFKDYEARGLAFRAAVGALD